MLSINGKKFMTLPEAVQWLLDNNALPFQCKVNYVADTVIAKTNIINPSPAEIRVGSLVLFADSKVGTVSGITDSGFMVGQEYTDIGAQLNQITGIDLDASSHLVFTLANGDTIDAGLIKQVTGLSINASQHLIVSYTDGTTADLGAIFTGNITISGDLTVTGKINNVSNPSVKPIYFHPIWVRDNVNNNAQFTMIILDNDPTPYTWVRILAFLDALPVGSRLNCSGDIEYTAASCDIVCLEKRGANDFMFRCNRVTDNVQLSIVLNDISFNPSNVEDGVNKIN